MTIVRTMFLEETTETAPLHRVFEQQNVLIDPDPPGTQVFAHDFVYVGVLKRVTIDVLQYFSSLEHSWTESGFVQVSLSPSPQTKHSSEFEGAGLTSTLQRLLSQHAVSVPSSTPPGVHSEAQPLIMIESVDVVRQNFSSALHVFGVSRWLHISAVEPSHLKH